MNFVLKALILTGWGLLLLMPVEMRSQNTQEQISSKKILVVRITGQDGHVLQQNRRFFKALNEDGRIFKAARIMEVELGWQVLGGKEWHQTANYPRMGVGLHHLHFVNRDELGHPFALYGFFDGNYFRTKRFELTNRMAAGLALGFKTYDPDDEHSNDIFCTKLNSFQELGLGIAMRLNRFIFLEPGVRFIHYSNGNVKEPQKGLNVYSYALSLRSALNAMPSEPVHIPLARGYPRHQVLTFLSMAPRQYDFIDNETPFHETYGLNFLMANLYMGYNYALTRQFRMGMGVDFFYDGTNGMKEAAAHGKPSKNAVSFRKKSGISIFAGGQKDIGNLSVVGDLGYVIVETRFPSSTPKFEQRLGFRYHFLPDIFAGVNVRAYNFRAAKTIEFNLGMRQLWGPWQTANDLAQKAQ